MTIFDEFAPAPDGRRRPGKRHLAVVTEHGRGSQHDIDGIATMPGTVTVTVRSHRGVLTETGPTMALQWYEPGLGMVIVSGRGMTVEEILAVAEGLER